MTCLLEITNDFKSNEGSNFFDIFRNKVQSSDIKIVRYFHEYGSNIDDIISIIRGRDRGLNQ